MDKFTIKPQVKSEGYKSALINLNTHDMLTQMKEETGASMVRLIEECVKFAFERLEIEEM